MESVLIIIGFNLIILFHTLRFSLCVDDVRQYQRVFANGFPPFFKAPIRAIQARLYGGATFGTKESDTKDTPENRLKAQIFTECDHLFTISLHTLAAVLIYFSFGASSVSFWAAILYSCHPTNAQTSIWLNGRRYIVNVILILGMIILSGYKYGWIAALPLYAFTGLMHVTAIFAPIAFIGLASVPFILAFYVLFHKHINERVSDRLASIQSKDWKNYSPKRLIIIIKSYGFYVVKMILPGVNMMNYAMLNQWGVTKKGNDDAYSFNLDFYTGIIALAGSVALVCAVPQNYKPYAVFMILSVVQWCAIIPATQLLADRYTSAAMPFAMLFLAYFIQSPIILAFIAGHYLVKLWRVSEMYESIFSYWKYQMYHAPHITTPRKESVDFLIQKGDYFKAFFYVREGLEYLPNDFALLHRAAICSKAIGSRRNSMEFVLKAEQNLYLDQEESQLDWCKQFKEIMKKEDRSQMGEGKRR